MKKMWIILAVVLAAGVLLMLRFSQAASQAPKAGEVQAQIKESPTRQEMILVPAGTFKMGDESFSRSKPVHEVMLTNDFYMGKYEVTNQQFADAMNYALSKGYLDPAFLAENKEKKEIRGLGKAARKLQDLSDEHSQLSLSSGKFLPFPGKENFPVSEVTWEGAAFYCNMVSEMEGLAPLYDLDDWSCQVYGKTGYRLPTEAEWEYAARYDDGRKYPWGDTEPDTTYANIKARLKDAADVATTAGGSYSPKGDSRLGICDMAGNMAEWCNDWYIDSYDGGQKVVDPVGPPPSLFINCLVFKEFRPLRVVRGGCYVFDPSYRKEYGVPFQIDSVLHAESVHNGFRSYDYWKISRQVEGFRVVKTVVTDKTKTAFSAPEK